MIKKILRSAAVGTIVLVALGTVMILTTGRRSTEDMPPAQEGVKAFYTVREYESAVGVFTNESGIPERIHTLFVRVLPADDRAALKNGICVSSEDELRSLIEDLTG